jgi:hypothetical protein
MAAAAMRAAIVGMPAVTSARGLAASGSIIAVFVVIAAVALDLTYLFLRRTADTPSEGRC